ncbi:MAG: DUF4317 domain-containing protein [Clostridiales bacterium]|nr:DUF4317 domain-containing protein [Clostridiales bacterium]
MIEKEVAELRRQLRPDRHSISRVYGCYVNEQKEIISTFEQPLGLLTEEENEQYLTLLKKVLSGGLGRSLLDIAFSTRQVAGSPEHGLLMQLRDSKLQDGESRQQFYEKVIGSVEFEGNYLILLAHNAYDVPFRSRDGARQDDASEEVFSYVLCSICPVKRTKPGLSYDTSEQAFHTNKGDWLVSPPQLGFLFPAFDDRSTNLYNALLYSRNLEDSHSAFVEAVFHTEPPKPAAEQKKSFEAVLSNALGDDCRLEVVQTVHEQLTNLITAHKESKSPEPLTVTRDEVGEMLDTCDISEAHRAAFNVQFDTEFGTGQAVSPGNLIDSRHFSVSTPSVVIQVDPTRSDLVQTRVIDGVKYLLIRADEDVEVNGVDVFLGDEP